MCKLDDILKTEQKSVQRPVQTRRGLSYDHIEYNTNVMFAVAKRLEMPLDKTVDAMRQKGLFKRLDRAYRNRTREKLSSVVKELSSEIVGA